MSQQISSNELEANLLRGWGILNTVITTTGTPSVLASSVDVSGILSVGDKLWIVQSTNKYVYVLAVDSTTITVSQSSDYTIVGTGITAISATYFSKHATPFGFPSEFNYLPSFTGFSANPTSGQYTYFIQGRTLFLNIRMPNNGTSNASGFSISLPVNAVTRTSAEWTGNAQIVNNGAVPASPGLMDIVSAASVCNVYVDWAGNLWTASGGKRLAAGTIIYDIA